MYNIGNLAILYVLGLDLPVDEPFEPHITIDFAENSSLWRSPKVTVEYLISELKKVGFKVTSKVITSRQEFEGSLI